MPHAKIIVPGQQTTTGRSSVEWTLDVICDDGATRKGRREDRWCDTVCSFLFFCFVSFFPLESRLGGPVPFVFVVHLFVGGNGLIFRFAPTRLVGPRRNASMEEINETFSFKIAMCILS